MQGIPIQRADIPPRCEIVLYLQGKAIRNSFYPQLAVRYEYLSLHARRVGMPFAGVEGIGLALSPSPDGYSPSTLASIATLTNPGQRLLNIGDGRVIISSNHSMKEFLL